MTHSILLTIHIAGALVGLLSGWTALLLRKGSRRHGAAGTIFFISMLSMCTSGVILAAMKQQTGEHPGRHVDVLSGGHRVADRPTERGRDRAS